MIAFDNIYRDRRVLLTGHTGFKGSWLSLWLKALGAKTTGLALSPNSSPSHWDLLDIEMDDKRIDIRNVEEVVDVIQTTGPEIVFHLAAQPLVRRSYNEPLETWSTNVMGAANVLEACRHKSSVKAIVVITTDKCYENYEWERAYHENDRLGGYDPYSASKAGAELVVSSYRDAFFSHHGTPLVASARAGNVIGGGDWSVDRLIPDLVRAINKKETIEIRHPNASRPWQHVLEPLSGYLCLGQKLIEGKKEFAQAWNFGPNNGDNRTVKAVLSHIKEEWPSIDWRVVADPQPHEANLLQLDSTKARQKLGWQPVWSFGQCIRSTLEWYWKHIESGAVISEDQLQSYLDGARELGLEWSR